MKSSIAVLLAAVAFAADGFAQELILEMTPELIAQAIKEGQIKNKKPPVGMYRVGGFVGSAAYPCFLSTPYSRVVRAAHDAFVEYKAFSATDVSPALVAPELWIMALPNTRQREPHGVRAVALTGKDGKNPLPPLRVEESQTIYSNAYGATSMVKAITAVYGLPIPASIREVHVVYEIDGDRKHDLDLRGVR